MQKQKPPTCSHKNRTLARLKQVNYQCTWIEIYLIPDTIFNTQLKQSVYFIRLLDMNQLEGLA